MRKLLLTVIPFALILACSEGDDTNVNLLPTVQNPAGAAKTLCFPDHGNGPAKWLHLGNHEDKNNVCFRDGTCFYGCEDDKP